MKMTTVQVGNNWYAIALECVREFLPPQRPAPVPGAPEPVLGIINLRGDILTAYDVSGRLGEPACAQSEGPHFMVVHLNNGPAAVAIGLPGDVHDWEKTSLNPPPPEPGDAPSRFQGIFDTQQGAVPWLDLETLTNVHHHNHDQ